MSLSPELKKWAEDAASAFSAAEDSMSTINLVGLRLREHFSSADNLIKSKFYGPLREAFKNAYVSKGKNEENVPGNWARALYQYAFPGEKKCSGRYYKLDIDGKSILDKERNNKRITRLIPIAPPAIVQVPAYDRMVPCSKRQLYDTLIQLKDKLINTDLTPLRDSAMITAEPGISQKIQLLCEITESL